MFKAVLTLVLIHAILFRKQSVVSSSDDSGDFVTSSRKTARRQPTNHYSPEYKWKTLERISGNSKAQERKARLCKA